MLHLAIDISVWPFSIGQASHHIRRLLSTLHSAVFLLNSRPEHFSATTQRFACSANARWHPFSRSYGVSLPSSLTRVISRTWESSSHPPVSVLVRLPSETRCYFLRASRHVIGSSCDSPWPAPNFMLTDLPISRSHAVTDTSDRPHT